jgi:hypothetical protein
VRQVANLLGESDIAGLYLLTQSAVPVDVVWDEGIIAVYQCAGRVSATIALTGAELAALAVATPE